MRFAVAAVMSKRDDDGTINVGMFCGTIIADHIAEAEQAAPSAVAANTPPGWTAHHTRVWDVNE